MNMIQNDGTQKGGENSAKSSFKDFIKNLISLDEDKDNDYKTIKNIRKGVEFKGSNLWILIFAIFIASIGLNVNSPAVIIGAMLISPLMGPIMGIGLGIGINDLDLIKRALFNLAVATLISVLTSTLYFLITPLSDAQSELLARTTPTLWDVLIALFGGLAGIIAHSRKDKSNAIPGVAIATALMPPLCTAGYGIATGNLTFFFGAIYLFFINSVFICVSTFIIVRYLKYPLKEFADIRQKRRVKNSILFLIIIVMLPSTYTGYRVVQKSIFDRNSLRFVQEEVRFPNISIVAKEFKFTEKEKKIELVLLGSTLSESAIQTLKGKLPTYGLQNVDLVVHQGYDSNEEINEIKKMNSQLKSSIIEELYKKSELSLKNKDEKIALLENEIEKLRSQEIPFTDISNEVKVQYSDITDFSISKTILCHLDKASQDTLYMAYAKYKRRPAYREKEKLNEWLKVRVKSPHVKLVVE